MKSNEEIKKSFPFDFKLIFTYIFKNGKLTIEQQYVNKSQEIMPMYPEFHPYFIAESKNIHYETDATKYEDYNDNKVKEYNICLN